MYCHSCNQEIEQNSIVSMGISLTGKPTAPRSAGWTCGICHNTYCHRCWTELRQSLPKEKRSPGAMPYAELCSAACLRKLG